MQIIGVCSEPDYTNGISKVLMTIHGDKQPEYVLFNLLKERIEFKAGKTYRITIEEQD